MTLRISAAARGNLRELTLGLGDAVAADVTVGVAAATDGAVMELRQELGRAFPKSRRMPTVVTGKATPDIRRDASLNAAGRIYGRGGKRSAWPAPLWAHAFGATIAPKRGRLAIPTDRVPRDQRNRPLRPKELEARFGEKLRVAPPGVFGKVAALYLAGDSKGIRGRRGRKAKPIVMYWLVPTATLPSRWQPRPIVERWAGLVPDLVDRARVARGSVR